MQSKEEGVQASLLRDKSLLIGYNRGVMESDPYVGNVRLPAEALSAYMRTVDFSHPESSVFQLKTSPLYHLRLQT